MYIDRDFKDLQTNIVFQKSFKHFPRMQIINGQMDCTTGVEETALEVTDSQTRSYENKLTLARARLFSQKNFTRAKLATMNSNLLTQDQTVVHHVHSVVGSNKKMHILGFLTKKEDNRYYLEDDTHAVKLAFDEIQEGDHRAYYTENSLVVCGGIQSNEFFYVTEIFHPPSFLRKQDFFRLVNNDNFGSYQKIKQEKLKAFLFPPEVQDSFNYQLTDSAMKPRAE